MGGAEYPVPLIPADRPRRRREIGASLADSVTHRYNESHDAAVGAHFDVDIGVEETRQAVARLNFARVDHESTGGTIVQRRNLKDRKTSTVNPLVEERLEALSCRLLERMAEIVGHDSPVGVRGGVAIHRLPKQCITELVSQHLQNGRALGINVSAEKDFDRIVYPFTPHDRAPRATIGFDRLLLRAESVDRGLVDTEILF